MGLEQIKCQAARVTCCGATGRLPHAVFFEIFVKK
jgi:hypothetical protein